MTKIQKIVVGVNLLFLMLYTLSLYSQKGQHLAIVGHAFMIAGHIIAIFIGGIVSLIFKEDDIANAFWLSAAIILLIGLGTCAIIYN